MKGYIIKEVNKDNYYDGSKMGQKFSGFYGAKIYRSHKLALKALDKVKSYGEFSIYEVEATVKSLSEDGRMTNVDKENLLFLIGLAGVQVIWLLIALFIRFLCS